MSFPNQYIILIYSPGLTYSITLFPIVNVFKTGFLLHPYVLQTCLNSCLAEKEILQCGCVEAQYPADAIICDKRNSTIGNHIV